MGSKSAKILTNGNQKIIARFRLSNEDINNKYWLIEEQRACRVCSWEEEILEHVWGSCPGSRDQECDVVDRLRDNEGAERWMRNLLKRRNELSN